jgi:hypothetical protein
MPQRQVLSPAIDAQSESQSASSADSVVQGLPDDGGAVEPRDALGGAVDSTVEQLTTLRNESTRGDMHKVRGSAHYTRYKFYNGLRNTLRELVEEVLVQTLDQMGSIARRVESSEAESPAIDAQSESPDASPNALPIDSHRPSSTDSFAQRLPGDGGAMEPQDTLGGAIHSIVEQLTTLQNESARGDMHKVRGSAHYTRYKLYEDLNNSLQELVEQVLAQTAEQMRGGIARRVGSSEAE